MPLLWKEVFEMFFNFMPWPCPSTAACSIKNVEKWKVWDFYLLWCVVSSAKSNILFGIPFILAPFLFWSLWLGFHCLCLCYAFVFHDRDIHDRDIHSRILFLRCKRESCVADIARDEEKKLLFDAQMAELSKLAIVGNIYLGQGTSMSVSIVCFEWILKASQFSLSDIIIVVTWHQHDITNDVISDSLGF